MFSEIENPKYQDVTAIKEIKTNSENSNKSYKDATSNLGLSLDPKVKASIEGVNVEVGKAETSYKRKVGSEESNLNSENFSTVFIRYFNIYEFINRIKALLENVGIKIVYLCLDDASELEKDALDLFVRTLVVPFNNTSSGFFKFKISFYPGRDHLPGIDRTKIETINLDYYYLYQATGVDKVEENAINYTKRLLEKRINYFLGSEHTIDDVFEIRSNFSINDYYRIIFQVTANVTRLIGKLLWYAAKRSIFSGSKITKRVLQESSKEHFEQEIETILTKSEYIQYKNYNERFEREHLKNLLDKIVQKAKDAKKQIGVSTAEIFKEYNTNNAPSNYLYFPPYMEDALATLELNFFISKFTQQRDRGIGTGTSYVPPKDVSVYTLNYGLCKRKTLL